MTIPNLRMPLVRSDELPGEPPAMDASGWRPIESAPKDGTDVLVYRGGRTYVARWLTLWETWGVTVERVPGEGNEPFTGIGRLAFGGHVAAEGPTHWMPLPAPPCPPTATAR